ncbi:MAG: alpha/beta hydrolase [Thermoguttaceae bacterium]
MTRRINISILAAAAILLLTGCHSPATFENSAIFQPARYPDGDWQPAGLQFEDARFVSADGTRLHGWYIPCENARATVLYCHGNGGNVAYWADAARSLHDRVGVSVLLFDYRGYGRSEGTPSEAGVLADARAARAWLAQREKIAEGQIVLMGRSLGGGVAVDLAAADGARALVLESTFTSLPDVAQTMFPLLPVRLLMQTRLNSEKKIANYHGPLLQSHGTADRLIPYAIGRRLFDAANQPKQFVPIANGDHNDPQDEEYYQALSVFLDTYPCAEVNHGPRNHL